MQILFADDTNRFCTGTDDKDMIRQINEEMAKIYARVNANKLSLNIDKTNFMMLTPETFFLLCRLYCYKPNKNTEGKRNKIPWCRHRQQAKMVCTYLVHQQKDL